MKAIVFLALLLLLPEHAASSCLADTNDADVCSEMQKQGNKMYEEIHNVDEIVQETIFRSIDEGGKMLESAILFLKTELVNVKVSSGSSTPIETSALTTLKTEIENVAKSSVATANKEILKELVNVIKRVESDSTFADNVARELGLIFTTKRRRRSVSTTDEFGSSVDGIVQKSLPVLNDTLKLADLKMQTSFRKFLGVFTSSIKTLLGGAVQLDFDQISHNMNGMLQDAALLLVDSGVSRLKHVIGSCVRHLQKIIELASKYKSDATKLRGALEPARMRVLEAIQVTKQVANEAALLKRIDVAVDKTVKYFAEIKSLVS